jgi:penicillin-binding protein 1C
MTRLLSLALRHRVFLVSATLLPLAAFALLSLAFPLPQPKPYSLAVEDRNGLFLHAYLAPDGIWRLRTDPSEIPDRLKRILIRREDRWFYHHPGVNPLALARAIFQNAKAGRRVSGGSTITMQIARMLEPRERSLWSKAIEVFRALQLEVKFSKEQLLELYLSMVPLGGNIEGLSSAGLLYYQTPPERLNIARLFDLILIPRDPNGLRPDRFPDRLLAERRRQARRWIAGGYLTRDDSLIIWDTPASVSRGSPPNFAPHYCLRIKERSRGGGNVRGTLDLRLQQCMEQLLGSHMLPWRARGVRNAAVIVVENRSRNVLAYTGSIDFDDPAANGQVDAARALRSPGSTLKPLLYAMLMDRGELTPKSRLLDVPYDAEGFTAENYDGTYSGPVFADDALRRSLNVPMVRLLKGVGAAAFADFAAGAGLHTLQAQKPRLGLSMILGGCGITLEELVEAYAAFPNGGMTAPLMYGHSDPGWPGEDRQAFSASAAFMVTQILSGMDRPDLPGGNPSSLPPVAFKTGTSYGRRDAWTIGFSATHTVGVWLGNVDNTGNPELAGGKAAAPLMFDILSAVSAGRETAILPAPTDVSMREVCAESGKDPTPRCVRRIDDLFSVSRTQRSSCDVCREYMVAIDGSVAYCPSCVGSHDYRIASIETYPPELLDFWKRSGVRTTAVPQHNPFCTTVAAGDGPAILSPSGDMIYYLASRLQKISLLAAPGADVGVHFWYLDDRYIGRAKAGRAYFVGVGEGDHVVSCVDDRGRVGKVRITVKIMGT